MIRDLDFAVGSRSDEYLDAISWPLCVFQISGPDDRKDWVGDMNMVDAEWAEVGKDGLCRGESTAVVL